MDNVLASGFVDNEIVVLKKINPYRAAQIVEQLCQRSFNNPQAWSLNFPHPSL